MLYEKRENGKIHCSVKEQGYHWEGLLSLDIGDRSGEFG